MKAPSACPGVCAVLEVAPDEDVPDVVEDVAPDDDVPVVDEPVDEPVDDELPEADAPSDGLIPLCCSAWPIAASKPPR